MSAMTVFGEWSAPVALSRTRPERDVGGWMYGRARRALRGASVLGNSAPTDRVDGDVTVCAGIVVTAALGSEDACLVHRSRDSRLRGRSDSLHDRDRARRRGGFTASYVGRSTATCSRRYRMKAGPFWEQGLIRASLELTLPRGCAPGTPDARCARRGTMP